MDPTADTARVAAILTHLQRKLCQVIFQQRSTVVESTHNQNVQVRLLRFRQFQAFSRTRVFRMRARRSRQSVVGVCGRALALPEFV